MDRKDHFLDSEMYLMTGKTACFSFDGRDYQDRSGFIEDFDEKLSTLEHDTLSRYGEELFECLFPPGTETRRGFYEASAIAAERRLTLRFRLRLGAGLPASIHRFSWECLRDRIQPLDLARATRIAFSRYFARGLTRPCPAVANPRVLGVISAPCDLSRYNMAKVDSKDLKQVLHGAFDTLDTAIQSEILDSPATRSRIRRHLQRAQCQVLHFLGHGSVDRQEISRLVLEDDQHKADFLTERELAELLSGLSDLRLVILTACHSGSSPQGGFSGLAGRLVEVGVPAVVAFRRSVPFSTAKLFTQYFYSELMRVRPCGRGSQRDPTPTLPRFPQTRRVERPGSVHAPGRRQSLVASKLQSRRATPVFRVARWAVSTPGPRPTSNRRAWGSRESPRGRHELGKRRR